MRLTAQARVAALVATTIAVATTVLMTAPSASAATPPYEPDPQSVGTLTFYDAGGNVVTSGSINSPLAAYAVGSATVRAGDVSAAVFGAQPNPNSNVGNWNVDQFTAFGAYPLTSGPAVVKTLSQTHPVATIGTNDENIAGLITDFPNTDPSGAGCAYAGTPAGCTNVTYQNLYQIRLETANSQGVFQTGKYDVADVLVSGTTWTQVYPTPAAGPTATTTTLTATETSPQNVGTTIHLTATLLPTSAAGSVQFVDGSTNIGSPIPVTSGHATTSTSALAAGPHTLHAVFTPTDSTAFGTSTGDLSFTMTSPATPTTTSLAISPNSPITVGMPSTLTATVTPSTAVGSVQFRDGATNIGSPVALTAGQASTTNTFALNTHQVTAAFTPTNPTNFATSTSNTVSYTVNPAPATTTTTTLGIAPTGPQSFGTTLTFTGTVSPNTAVGQVQFLDGSTVVATGTVSGGSATGTSSTLNAGLHSITAKFVPTDPTAFGTSTSSASSYTISQASTTTTLSVSPASPQVQGTSLALTATISPTTLAGAVQFFDGASAIGSPVMVTSGHATLNWSALGIGDHVLKATFQPSSVNYASSSSDGSSFTVSKPPPANTSTTLQVTPGGPVGPNTVETLHATITPATAAGSVQFKDGATAIGSAVTVTGGVAQTTATLAVGTHSLQAVFTPTDSTDFNTSQSAAQSYEVKPPAASTTTSLAAAPSGSSTFGQTVTLTATVSPSAAGAVTFKDGATTIGTQPVASGTATLMTVALAGGSHSLTATFTPAAPLDFAPSTSSAVSYTVNAVTTTTSLAVTPGGPVGVGASVTITATVSPSAATGSVIFKNGATTLASKPVSSGKATLTTTSLPAGTASITATFTATAPNNFAGSASAPVTLDVVAAPMFTSVTSGGKTLHNGDTLNPDQSVTLAGSGFQPDESVEVDVHSAATKLATTQADASGHISVTVTLPSTLSNGTHTLTATGALGTATFSFVVDVTTAPATPTTPAGSSSGSGTGGLAETGSDVFGGLLLGSVLAAAGALALLLGKRRHRGLHRVG